MLQIDLRPGRHAPLLAAAASTVLLLAACSTATPTPAASTEASEPPAARCAVQADADPAATVTISGTAFGDEVTIAAGEAVEFTNEDSFGHTVTEGTGGVANADACVNEPIAAGATVVVTFSDPGDYQITCTIHASMQTAVHVE